MQEEKSVRARVHALSPEVARKIAAGEVIDRPCAILRELLDNAVDSGANKISVEIESGGIEKIRVVDNGCGMSKEDLASCARPHATSKISNENDLLNLTTLGFRGEALASMAAVSRLEITSGGWKMKASLSEDHLITPSPSKTGCIVQTAGLFENFPARRVFLKRPSSEANLCKAMFEEKAIARPDIELSFTSDGEEKANLPAGQSYKERFVQALGLFENEELFYELKGNIEDEGSFRLIIGEPDVSRSNRKDIYIYVNGRRVQEFSLIQAIEYGCQGYFPNGSHPVACLFAEVLPSLVDFNIHPAKKEVRFKDISKLHHAVSQATKNFFKQFTVQNMVNQINQEDEEADLLNETFTDSSFYKIHDSFTNKVSSPSQHDFINRYMPANKSVSYSSFSHSSNNRGPSIPDRPTKANYIESEGDMADPTVHFVGLTMGTFIIAEKNDVLYIIDQHAAHERYLYNKIMAGGGKSQKLLLPYVIQTESDSDDAYLQSLAGKMKEAGYEGKNCGNGRWEFTAVPEMWKGNEEDLKRDLLDRRINPSDMINASVASAACRSAVMDGMVLDTKTAAWIAKIALELPDPHCPHGRPVYTTITRRQLFSLVKRM